MYLYGAVQRSSSSSSIFLKYSYNSVVPKLCATVLWCDTKPNKGHDGEREGTLSHGNQGGAAHSSMLNWKWKSCACPSFPLLYGPYKRCLMGGLVSFPFQDLEGGGPLGMFVCVCEVGGDRIVGMCLCIKIPWWKRHPTPQARGATASGQ